MALSSGHLKTPAKLRHFLPALSSISSRVFHPAFDDYVSSARNLSNQFCSTSSFEVDDTHCLRHFFRNEEDDESDTPSVHRTSTYRRCVGQPQPLERSLSFGLVGALRSRKFGTCARGSLRELGVGAEVRLWRQGKNELVTSPVLLEFRRGHTGHAHHHHHHHHTPGQHDNTGKAGERVLRWGLWGDIILSIGKGAAGFVSGSTAIIADAAHSVSDIALSGVALWSAKVASAPKDKEHPYGHGKFETVGALCISGVLMLTGGGIAWHAVETLQAYAPLVSEMVHTGTEDLHQHGGGHHHGIDLEHPYVALSAAVVSIVVKEALYWQTKLVGEQQKSELLKASAWHHRSDAISSVVALIGVGGAIAGMPLLDPVAGLLVSGMIVKAGMETGYQSLQDLVDIGAPESVLSPIRVTVLQVPGVEGCHHLRGRRMGSFLHVDAHIEVDPWLSVSAAYQIGQAVRHKVQKEYPEVAETFVHIEPADGGSKTVTEEEAEKEAHQHDHHTDSEDHSHHAHKNQHQFRKSDLTKNGSKSDLLNDSTLLDEEGDTTSGGDSRQHSEVEQDVRNVVKSNFSEKMTIVHVTSHYLKGRVVVEVEVLMNPEISVRDAKANAHDAEEFILREVKDISAVDIQLKLSKSKTQSIPSP
ncbi:hypothetical protein R1flu_007520 [Riccia fluitans]|uniref:Cation efflux protein cytoplasmic domain-containing protein n=1 Tax=Riccia fluitans TaxID=41844 RepID=A0ABD1YZ52_9MARC